MELLKGIEVVDIGLFLKEHKTLIIADIHIGYEESLNKKGILVPRFQLKDVLKKLENIIEKTKPETIIINGDLKHEFGKISEQEWRDTLKILDLLTKHSKVILVKGNHDTILGPIAEKRNVKVVDNVLIDNIYITHGDKIPKIIPKVKTVIIGHEHPAITISDNNRKETFKCFLLGKWKRKNLIVMPSLNQVTQGSDILEQKLLSPFLTDISHFKVFVVEDKIYDFGKVYRLTK